MKRYIVMLNEVRFNIYVDEKTGEIILEEELRRKIFTEIAGIISPFTERLMVANGKTIPTLFVGIKDAYIEGNDLYVNCFVFSSYNFTNIKDIEEEAKLHNFRISFIEDRVFPKNIFTKTIPVKEVENNFDNEEEWLRNELNKIFNKGV